MPATPCTGTAIRDACRRDLEEIRTIYNHYVVNSVATFDQVEQSSAARAQWFDEHAKAGLPVIVAERDGQIIGWGALSRYHSRCAYKQTVEPSVYIKPGHTGAGLGRTIMEQLVTKARQKGYHAIVGLAAGENQASIKMLKSLGFEEAGCLKEVGRKFDRWLDVTLMQRVL